MSGFNVKKGDYVMIIAGKDKGKSCLVTGIDTAKARALVEGKDLATVNKKAVKGRKASDKSGIIDQPGTVDISNLMPICSACNKPSRVRKSEIDGKKVRICVKCGEVLLTKKPAPEKKTKAKATVRRKSAAKKTESKPKVEETVENKPVETATEEN